MTALLSVYDTRHHGFASIYHWTIRVFRAEIISVTPGLSNETLPVGALTPIEAGALPLSPGFKDFVHDAFAVSNESAKSRSTIRKAWQRAIKRAHPSSRLLSPSPRRAVVASRSVAQRTICNAGGNAV